MQPPTVTIRTVVAFLPYAVVGAVHLWSKLVEDTGVDQFTKPLLMPVLVVGMLSALPRWRTGATLFAVLGLAFSWAGDVLLQSPGQLGFLIGLGCFLLAHVAYLVLIICWLRMRRLGWPTLVYLAWWLALVVVLAPHLGSLLVPVAVYGLVLGAMAGFAATGRASLVAGGALFLVSDTLLGLNRFLPGFELWQVDFLVMLSYILAQGLIAFAVVRSARMPPITDSVSVSVSPGS